MKKKPFKVACHTKAVLLIFFIAFDAIIEESVNKENLSDLRGSIIKRYALFHMHIEQEIIQHRIKIERKMIPSEIYVLDL